MGSEEAIPRCAAFRLCHPVGIARHIDIRFLEWAFVTPWRDLDETLVNLVLSVHLWQMMCWFVCVVLQFLKFRWNFKVLILAPAVECYGRGCWTKQMKWGTGTWAMISRCEQPWRAQEIKYTHRKVMMLLVRSPCTPYGFFRWRGIRRGILFRRKVPLSWGGGLMRLMRIVCQLFQWALLVFLFWHPFFLTRKKVSNALEYGLTHGCNWRPKIEDCQFQTPLTMTHRY